MARPPSGLSRHWCLVLVLFLLQFLSISWPLSQSDTLFHISYGGYIGHYNPVPGFGNPVITVKYKTNASNTIKLRINILHKNIQGV